MATAVEKAIDVAADAAEDVAEESAQVAEATRALSPRDVGLVFGGLGVGVAIGVAGGYFVLKTRLKTKYEQISDEEIAGMKEHYDRKLKALDNKEEKQTLDTVVKDLEYVTDGKDGGGRIPYHLVGSEPDKVGAEGEDEAVRNVFVENSNDDPEVKMSDGWNYTLELAGRSPGVPYVIHRDEYNEESKETEGYEQYTLTYFEGDDVLCREDDTIITDQDTTVGLGNLSKFGHGSGDPNIVYIRNEELKVNLEIVHSDGKYATEVAGFPEDELQHSSMRRRSPRRSEYDPDR